MSRQIAVAYFLAAAGILNSFGVSAVRATTAGAAGSAQDLSRYLEIVEREPFGEITPSEEVDETPAPSLQEPFAQNLQMRAIIDDGKTIRVGFLDKQKDKTFYISLGETVEGIELVSVDYDKEEALLRKGQETSVFGLRQKRVEEVEEQPQPSRIRRRPFFADLARQQPKDGEAPPTPFRGKTIEEFMREHPDAAMKHPSPLRPSDSSESLAERRSVTMERFLKEAPDADRRFSPFRPVDPSERVEGQNEIIERFMQEHSGEEQRRPPTPIIITPEAVPFLFEGISGDLE